MRKKIKIIDLLCLISNGEEVPKVIAYENKVYHYVEEYKDYVYDDAYCLIGDYFVNHYGITMYLNDEVEILDNEEDKGIPLIPDDELYITANSRQDYNFKVLKEKINQVVEEFNEYRKGNE